MRSKYFRRRTSFVDLRFPPPSPTMALSNSSSPLSQVVVAAPNKAVTRRIESSNRTPRTTMFHNRSQAILLIAGLFAVFTPLDVSAASYSRRHRRGESTFTSAPTPSGKAGKGLLAGGTGDDEFQFLIEDDDGFVLDSTSPRMTLSPSFGPSSMPSASSDLSPKKKTPTDVVTNPRMTLSPSFEPSSSPSESSGSKKKTSPPVVLDTSPRMTLSPTSSTSPPSKAPVTVNLSQPTNTPSVAGVTGSPVADPAPASISFSTPFPTSARIGGPTSIAFSTIAPTSNPTILPFVSPISEGEFTDTSGPFEINDSAVMCPGFTPARQAVVWWTYSVTLDLPEYTAEDADGAVQVVEQVLRSDLLGLLQCDNPTGRMLASDFGIVGIDFLPDDLREEECYTVSTVPCFVFIGSMFIYLEEGADQDIAVLETRREIRDNMSAFIASSIPKVESLEYLAPDLPNPSSAESAETRTVQNNEIVSSTVIPILSAVGAVFVMLTLVAAYRFRKERTEQLDGPSTIGPPATMGGSSTVANASPALSNNPDTPAPAFSGMLPGTYRQSYRMGAILEDGSDSASYSRTSDIIVSECGYTDDDSSRDQSYLSSMLHEDPILGARGMDEEYEPDDEYLYDTSEPNTSQKGVRFSTEA